MKVRFDVPNAGCAGVGAGVDVAVEVKGANENVEDGLAGPKKEVEPWGGGTAAAAGFGASNLKK